MNGQTFTTERRTTAGNSTYPKGGVSCSKDSLVVNQTFVFQIKFSGKSPALRVAAKRYVSCFNKQLSVYLSQEKFNTKTHYK
jgi:hypothetical protein